MDEDEVDDRFMGMAMNNYRDSIENFIEGVRVNELKVRVAIGNGEHEQAARLSEKLFHGISAVQVGNVPNLITGFGHALNDERMAGLEVFGLGEAVLADLRTLHQHLVSIGQPNDELMMITDLMAKLSDGLDSSVYGRMDVPE